MVSLVPIQSNGVFVEVIIHKSCTDKDNIYELLTCLLVCSFFFFLFGKPDIL